MFAKKITLQLNLKEGSLYNLKTTTQQQIIQKIQGQEQEINQTIGAGYTFSVEEVDKYGVAKIKITYNSTFFKRDSLSGKVEYDSSKSPTEIPEEAKGFAALVGESFLIWMSSKGEVLDVKGADDIVRHVVEKFNLTDESMKVSMEQDLKEQFGDKALQESMGNMMGVYPDAPVGIGDSWERASTVSRGLPIVLENVYKFKAQRGHNLIIEVYSKIKPNPAAAPAKRGPILLKYILQGEQKGTIQIKETTGWISSAKVNQQLSGKVSMQVASLPKIPHWPISMKSVDVLESQEIR
jgi:hypothetical protein